MNNKKWLSRWIFFYRIAIKSYDAIILAINRISLLQREGDRAENKICNSINLNNTRWTSRVRQWRYHFISMIIFAFLPSRPNIHWLLLLLLHRGGGGKEIWISLRMYNKYIDWFYFYGNDREKWEKGNEKEKQTTLLTRKCVLSGWVRDRGKMFIISWPASLCCYCCCVVCLFMTHDWQICAQILLRTWRLVSVWQ